jgi:Holliday junction resolvase RusA-like endonuclease
MFISFKLDFIPSTNEYFAYPSVKRQFISHIKLNNEIKELRISRPIRLSIVIKDRNAKKRDLDNYLKCLIDSLVALKIIKDDRLIYEIKAKKAKWNKDFIQVKIKITIL